MSYDVIITGKSMGQGEEALAENLMLAFINTLAGKENLPEHVWFYGDGAYLTSKGSDALDDLKALEEKGVSIATCGTCTNYYELEDHLEVGEIKTMSDFVDLFGESESLVFP